MLVLNAPARPRSPERKSTRMRFSSRRTSSGCSGDSIRAIVERSTRASSRAYGRAASAASCARRSRAAATNFIARVICCVFFTERMRRRKSRSVGIVVRQPESLACRSSRGHGEALLERLDGGLDFRLDAIVECLLRRDVLQYRRIICLRELQELAFEAADLRHGDSIEPAGSTHLNDQDLLLCWQRHILILFQNFRQPLPPS